jgi:hypothetical protein
LVRKTVSKVSVPEPFEVVPNSNVTAVGWPVLLGANFRELALLEAQESWSIVSTDVTPKIPIGIVS